MSGEGVFLVGDAGLVEMGASPYAAEVDLQDLLVRYPSLLAGRQVDPVSPRRWLLIAREQGIPEVAGGLDRWSLDHLFVDQDGVPTLVEVKRSTDTRIRREVVGQMLDYAANGVRYWPPERLRGELVARAGSEVEATRLVTELLTEAPATDIDVDAFWHRVGENRRAGRLRMLFVADEIPDSLKRIIEFLNEQMTQCEVLGIEIRRYAADGHQVFAPTVYGQTSQAREVKGKPGGTFDEALAAASKTVREVDDLLLTLSEAHGWVVTKSRTARQHKLPDKTFLFQLYPADEGGAVELFLGGLYDAGLTEDADSLRAELSSMAGRELTRRIPWVTVETLRENWTRLADDWIPRYVEAHRQAARRR
ncbi:hypothetical protein [Georgenia muralis]